MMRGMMNNSQDFFQDVRLKPIKWRKIIEVSFWGAIFWGLFRMVFFFLNFTPYGVRAFSRPLVGASAEDSYTAIVLGIGLLFFYTLIATVIYSILLSGRKIWWLGILYGLAFMVVFGFFFHFMEWTVNTLSTELAWFLSFGLFIGMTLTAERFSEE